MSEPIPFAVAINMGNQSRPVAGLHSSSSSSDPGLDEFPEMDEQHYDECLLVLSLARAQTTQTAAVAEVAEQHHDECPICYEPLLPHQRKFHWDCNCRLPFHALCVIAWVERKQEHQRCPTCNAPHTPAVRQRLSQCCHEAHQRALRVQPFIFERPLPRSRLRSRSRSIVRTRRLPNGHDIILESRVHVRCCPYLQIRRYIQVAGGPSRQFYVDDRCALRHNYGVPFWRCTVCSNRLEANHAALRLPNGYDWPHCRCHGYLVVDIDLITGRRSWMCSYFTPTPSHQVTTVDCAMPVTSLGSSMETNRSEYASQLDDFAPPVGFLTIRQRWRRFRRWRLRFGRSDDATDAV